MNRFIVLMRKVSVMLLTLGDLCSRYWEQPVQNVAPENRRITPLGVCDVFCKLFITAPVIAFQALLGLAAYLWAVKLGVTHTSQSVFGHPPQSWSEWVVGFLLLNLGLALLLRGATVLGPNRS
jgi:hypothetical protein